MQKKKNILYLLRCIDRDVTAFTLHRADSRVLGSCKQTVLFFEGTLSIEVTIRAFTSLHVCSNDATLSVQLTHMHKIIITVKGNRRCLHAQC